MESGQSLTYSKHLIQHLPPKVQELLLPGKQAFPYEYVDGMNRLRETSIPSLDDVLQLAHRVWDEAACQTLGDYMESYLRLDVGLLADVFCRWRSTLREKYALDMLGRLTESSVRGGLTICVRPLNVTNKKHINPQLDSEKEDSLYISYI